MKWKKMNQKKQNDRRNDRKIEITVVASGLCVRNDRKIGSEERPRYRATALPHNRATSGKQRPLRCLLRSFVAKSVLLFCDVCRCVFLFRLAKKIIFVESFLFCWKMASNIENEQENIIVDG